METKYYKKDDKIIIEIPFLQDGRDYFGDKVCKIPNIIGIIETNKNGDEECGFHKLIDMTYKGKAPQVNGLLVSFYGNKKEFIELCEELDIEIIEYQNCAYCGESILGSHTVGDKGIICYSCQLDKKNK